MKISKNPDIPNPKYAVVTRARDDYELARITQPNLSNYAFRCGSDFVVINEAKRKLGNFSYEILQCYELFQTYERILVVDSDVIINPRCPNIFELVPYDYIGTVYEDKYSRMKDRRHRIQKIQEAFGDVGWKKGYINTGFFVCSRIHKEIFSCLYDKIWTHYGYDDVYLGYRIHQLKLKVFELPYKFNHMSMFSEIGRNWLKSYVIHYAGRGFSGKKSQSEQIQEDLRLLSEKSLMMLNFCHPFARLRLIAMGLYQYIAT
jgi:lipopolysaccharide biosynthesis glycosyltransferase